ncbi:ankyrin repeat domain-containing protein [Singulisphaera sp. PoT]|uniref:ankyrin repeat domain-containing protein n=1 Tax=Singulisphaera sp. PoT TaxID=3411797 RepID=UPI003BF5A4DA
MGSFRFLKHASLSLILTLAAMPLLAAEAPLADAAEKRDLVGVRGLITKHVEINQAQADGMTALHWAVYHDDLEAAKLLLDAKADAKAMNRYGVSPLSLACRNGDERMVAMLLDAGADPNTKLRGDETVLMIAARTGKLGPVKALIARGADVNAKERRGQTPLMWAAAEGNAEVVEALLKAGADFRAALPSGFTPMLFAVREGRIEVVRLLLKAGIDVNQPIQAERSSGRAPAKGTTPLILAIENGHFELAAVLLDAGADPNEQRSGFTPLHTLTWVRKASRGDDEAGDPSPIGSGNLSSLELAEALVKHGADVNARLKRGIAGTAILSRRGATPYLLASMTADVPYMKTLLKLGADPKIPNSQNCTPLMAASGIGSLAPGEDAGTEEEAIEAVKLNLELGNDINAVDDNGETVMHGAAYKCLPGVVQLLFDRGAKVEVWNTKNKHGWTPLAIAEGHRPGTFRPSPETITAIRHVMLSAGVTPPSRTGPFEDNSGYSAEAKAKAKAAAKAEEPR